MWQMTTLIFIETEIIIRSTIKGGNEIQLF